MSTYPRNAPQIQSISLVEDSFLLVKVSELGVHVRPFFNQQKLTLSFLPLRPSCQCVAGNEQVRPRSSGRCITLFLEVAMYTNDIDSCAFHRTVREILNTVYGLRP
jgi:hypothetical protein